jgi:Ca-activated chloride channel homolog
VVVVKGVLLLALAAVLLQADAREARQLYERGEPAAAAELLRQPVRDEPGSLLARYNLGTALLAAGELDEAREHLVAASGSENDTVAQAARYNLGNSYLVPVFEAEPSPERREALVLAVLAYREALLIRSDDVDAKWNLELAQRLLRESPPPPTPDSPAGGGGAGETPRPGALGDPAPQPAEGPGPQPRLTPEEAEELIASAEEREVGTQQERLRRPQPPVQAH